MASLCWCNPHRRREGLGGEQLHGARAGEGAVAGVHPAGSCLAVPSRPVPSLRSPGAHPRQTPLPGSAVALPRHSWQCLPAAPLPCARQEQTRHPARAPGTSPGLRRPGEQPSAPSRRAACGAAPSPRAQLQPLFCSAPRGILSPSTMKSVTFKLPYCDLGTRARPL